MNAKVMPLPTVIVFLTCYPLSVAEDVLFEDNFDHGLSSMWQIAGLAKEDFRIRDGGLELRVQPGKLTRNTPMLRVVLPFDSSQTVVASVDVKVLDQFTEPAEFGGLYLTDGDGVEFGVKKRRFNGHLVYSPGNVQFTGAPGEEGDFSKYALKFRSVADDAGPLRIIVRSHYAHFQVGPSSTAKYLNFFHTRFRRMAVSVDSVWSLPVAPWMHPIGSALTIFESRNDEPKFEALTRARRWLIPQDMRDQPYAIAFPASRTSEYFSILQIPFGNDVLLSQFEAGVQRLLPLLQQQSSFAANCNII